MRTQTNPLSRLPLQGQLRLTAAITDAAKDKKISAEELASRIAPIADEFHVTMEELGAIVSSVVGSLNDGSRIDPEAQRTLAAASARFELGNAAPAEPEPAAGPAETNLDRITRYMARLSVELDWKFMSKGDRKSTQQAINAAYHGMPFSVWGRRPEVKPVHGVSRLITHDNTVDVFRGQKVTLKVSSLKELEAVLKQGVDELDAARARVAALNEAPSRTGGAE